MMKKLLFTFTMAIGLSNQAYAFWFTKTKVSSQPTEQEYLADKQALEARGDQLAKEGPIHPYFWTYTKCIGAGIAFGSIMHTAFRLRRFTNKRSNLKKIQEELQHAKATKESQDPFIDKLFANKNMSYKYSPAFIIKDLTNGSQKRVNEQAKIKRFHEPLDRLHENIQYNNPGMQAGLNMVRDTALFAIDTVRPVVLMAACAQLFKNVGHIKNIIGFCNKHTDRVTEDLSKGMWPKF